MIGALIRRYVIGGLMLAAIVVLVVTGLHGCSGSQNYRAAQASVVIAGDGVAALQTAHQGAYRVATDALLSRGLRGAEYAAAVIPLDAEFARRGRAIQALDVDVYAAAAIVDAVHAGAPLAQVLDAARQSADALNRDLHVLAEGAGGVLPPLAIPPAILGVSDAIHALAGGQ